MGKTTDQRRGDITMPVKYLKGVGEVRSRWLARLGINSILELMEFFPHTYIQRQINPSLHEVQAGDRIALTAMICWKEARQTAKNINQLNLGISDGKSLIICTWFHYPKQYEELFEQGKTIWVSGNVSEFNGQLQLLHPQFELITDSDLEDDFWKKRSVLPVYHLAVLLTQNLMRKLIYSAFEQYALQIRENLPQELIDKYSFPTRREALQKMHFTTHPEQVEGIRFRFVYEEFFYTQLMWARHKHYHQENVSGIAHEHRKVLTRELYKKLPYKLTNAQIRVIREIFADMQSDRQMSRLLQGDVGSGKTIVTLFAMLLSIENGFQAVLMAPTEILADQHYANITKLLEGMQISTCLLKGGSYKGKSQVKQAIAQGEIQIIVGTHAILQSDIEFASLGFAAVDEQHRFGVEQRAQLARKDKHPDLLYLSATPIPRSLSMTVYGDLEVSILDELPPNRKPVTTLVRSSAKIDLVYNEARRELQKGRQIYIVCPLIEESDKVDLIDAERLFKHISEKVFKGTSCALLHGRMKAREKDGIMLRFKAGEVKILVSTTVIEVGVDVPNASVMIVEHAERFGLAQLHQLRGRVGRGTEQAYCYLIEHFPISAIGRERLSTIAGTTDGFAIAEKDLELRGPGEYFGYEQSGLPRFRFANLLKDQDVLRLARMDAFDLVSSDPDLQKEENLLIRQFFFQAYGHKEELILY